MEDYLHKQNTQTSNTSDDRKSSYEFKPQTQYLTSTPIQLIITSYCDNKLNDYIFHTKLFLEYDEENAFIFIFKNGLIFTKVYDEKSETPTENPIIYSIKFMQVRK